MSKCYFTNGKITCRLRDLQAVRLNIKAQRYPRSGGLVGSAILLKWVNNVKKRELVEICITCINRLNTVFLHQYSSMSIENEITGNSRELLKDLG